MTPLENLHAHSAEFAKTVHKLAPNMYLAVGFAASNVGMIVGDDGLIIIDTTESTKAAENVLAAFREITDKPVRTIIYTHSHRDHISGATVFAGGAEVEIIAHAAFDGDLLGGADKPGPHRALMARTARQFGIGLEFGTERVNLGLGPGDRPTEGLGQGHIPPNHWVDEDGARIMRNGVEMELAMAPGECADTLAVWLPGARVLFSADNFYKSFPNLYAIRGTPYRDFDIWADTLARLAQFGAEVLAPGHSRPIHGAASVAEVLADYEEAIRFVIAQTSDGMNRGMTPDELAQHVRLPARLAAKPYLQEFYGTLAWAVRAYFSGTLGWFDGDPASLFPLPPLDEAARFAALAGGEDKLADAVLAAGAAGDHQWVLELSGRLLRLRPDHAGVKAARIAAMRALADNQVNACARNYYLLSAKQAEAQG
jgi:uncharacterized sulfatase